MKVFVSWSGLVSGKVATAIKDWLSNSIQAASVFVSSEDIEKGQRWFPEISKQLEEIHFGILCLTPDNLTAPWVLFEAGALSKSLGQSYVCPLVIGMKKTELTGPLAQFQATSTEKEDLKGLLKTINKRLTENQINESKLEKIFEKWWPDLEKELNEALDLQKADTTKAPKPKRDQRDILEEVLELTRSISQRLPGKPSLIEHMRGLQSGGLPPAATDPSSGSMQTGLLDLDALELQKYLVRKALTAWSPDEKATPAEVLPKKHKET